MEEPEGLEFDQGAVKLDGEDVTGLVITIHDAMSAGHCVRGVKRWFSEYGLDFSAFLQQGIPAYDFLSTRDGHAIGIVRQKVKRDGRSDP